MLNIVIISTSDIGHGAGIAAYRLHHALRRKGVNSSMIVSIKSSCDDTVFPARQASCDILSRAKAKAARSLEYALNTMTLQNIYSFNGRGLLGHDLVINADIVHFHNIHWPENNFSLLHLLNCKKPLVWTLHDMWPITGHCFTSIDCQKWKTGCGRCPDLDVLVKLSYDSTAIQWKLKKWIYRMARPVIVTPSNWLRELVVRDSMLKGSRVERIPNGIDLDVFKPHDKAACRKDLELGKDEKVISFVASALHEKHKGYDLFEKAMINYRNGGGRATLLIAGSSPVSKGLTDHYKIKKLGYIKDPKHMALCFSAADIFVMPSIQDNLPNVVLESLACGTPVVAFRVGGLPDMIEHMGNGYLADACDANGLTSGIKTLLDGDPSLLIKLSIRAQEKVREEYTYDICAETHMKLYTDLLK